MVIFTDIDLKLEGPRLTCIMSSNMVGKSTLVKCLNKLFVPKSR